MGAILAERGELHELAGRYQSGAGDAGLGKALARRLNVPMDQVQPLGTNSENTKGAEGAVALRVRDPRH